MANESLTFPSFVTPSSRTGMSRTGIVLTQDEIDDAALELEECTSQFERVKVLYSRGWSTSQMQQVLKHSHGGKMSPQMINGYLQKIRAKE
jgi:hypothetical protein